MENPLEQHSLRHLKNLSKDEIKKPSSSFEEVLKQGNISGKVSSSKVQISNEYIKDEIKDDPYRKKLFSACGEFESMFVKMMLKEMKNTVGKTKLIHGGYAEEIFEDFLYDEYSKKVSQNESFGLAEDMYKTLSKSLSKNR